MRKVTKRFTDKDNYFNMAASQQHQGTPIHPNQLFQQLLSFDKSSIQCTSKAKALIEQKDIIANLLVQYMTQINKIKAQISMESQLKLLKNSRMQELLKLRQQRAFIDQRFGKQIEQFRMNPVQVRDNLKSTEQLQKYRQSNAKLSIRIRQLYDYTRKLQAHNLTLQQERKVVTSDNTYYDQNWRTRIQQMRKSQDQYMQQIKFRMKENNIRTSTETQHLEMIMKNQNRINNLIRTQKMFKYR